jgi:hypothetical protein
VSLCFKEASLLRRLRPWNDVVLHKSILNWRNRMYCTWREQSTKGKRSIVCFPFVRHRRFDPFAFSSADRLDSLDHLNVILKDVILVRLLSW